jgi:hypothetical protein
VSDCCQKTLRAEANLGEWLFAIFPLFGEGTPHAKLLLSLQPARERAVFFEVEGFAKFLARGIKNMKGRFGDRNDICTRP